MPTARATRSAQSGPWTGRRRAAIRSCSSASWTCARASRAGSVRPYPSRKASCSRAAPGPSPSAHHRRSARNLPTSVAGSAHPDRSKSSRWIPVPSTRTLAHLRSPCVVVGGAGVPAPEEVVVAAIRYRPGQRHVLRVDAGRTAFFAKVYRDEAGRRQVVEPAQRGPRRPDRVRGRGPGVGDHVGQRGAGHLRPQGHPVVDQVAARGGRDTGRASPGGGVDGPPSRLVPVDLGEEGRAPGVHPEDVALSRPVADRRDDDLLGRRDAGTADDPAQDAGDMVRVGPAHQVGEGAVDGRHADARPPVGGRCPGPGERREHPAAEGPGTVAPAAAHVTQIRRRGRANGSRTSYSAVSVRPGLSFARTRSSATSPSDDARQCRRRARTSWGARSSTNAATSRGAALRDSARSPAVGGPRRVVGAAMVRLRARRASRGLRPGRPPGAPAAVGRRPRGPGDPAGAPTRRSGARGGRPSSLLPVFRR